LVFIRYSISVEGSQLFLKNKEKFAQQLAQRLAGEEIPPDTFALVGGDITLKDNQLLTYGNDAHFISVASAGEPPVNPMDLPIITLPLMARLV